MLTFENVPLALRGGGEDVEVEAEAEAEAEEDATTSALYRLCTLRALISR